MPTANDFTMEWSGPLALEDAHRLLDAIGAKHLQSLRIELSTNQEHALPAAMLPTESEETAASGTSAESMVTPEQDPATADPQATDSTPRLQGDSDSFNILRLLRSEGGWLRTKDLREVIPERWDVNEDNLGSVLWNLTERELVEKRPYEDDKRETEYQVTPLGEQALDEAFHRAQSSDDVDPDPLPEDPPAADD